MNQPFVIPTKLGKIYVTVNGAKTCHFETHKSGEYNPMIDGLSYRGQLYPVTGQVGIRDDGKLAIMTWDRPGNNMIFPPDSDPDFYKLRGMYFGSGKDPTETAKSKFYEAINSGLNDYARLHPEEVAAAFRERDIKDRFQKWEEKTKQVFNLRSQAEKLEEEARAEWKEYEKLRHPELYAEIP